MKFTYFITYNTGEASTTVGHETPGGVLLNRMAREFPGYYSDSVSGITITEPRADWTKTSSPVSWTQTDRNQYRVWYMSTFNQPNFNWAGIEIHHIQPREYGGINSISNLIPLPSSVHVRYTSWFAGY